MNIGGPLHQRFPDDLVHELHDAGLLVFVRVDHARLVLHLEVLVIEIPSFQDLLERIRPHSVEPSQSIVHPAAGGHPPDDGDVHGLNRSLPRREVEGIEGRDHETLGATLLVSLEVHRKQAVAQGNLWTADLPQGERLLGRRNDVQPIHPQQVAQRAHVRLLVDDVGIENIVKGRTLSGRGGVDNLREPVEVRAAGIPGRFDQQFCHINGSE